MSQNTAVSDLLRPKIEKQEITYFHIFIISISIILYILDYGFDIKLAVNHFNDGNVWYFVQTVCSIVIPALILTGFNIWWYKIDAVIVTSKVSINLWIIRIIFIVLLMAPLLRNFEALYYAIKGRRSTDKKKKEKYFLRMTVFITDAAILTVFEAFMESGPQVVLQTCIFAQLQASNPNIFTVTEMWQVATILVSLFSMSAAYTTYQRCLRFSLNDRGKLNFPRMISLTIWRFFDVTSRVIALGLFASVFPYYLIIVCFVHFIVMFYWIRSMKTNFCENNIREIIYNLVLADIFVFFYFNPKDEKTKQRYIIYYSLIFLENTALICVWYYYYSPDVHFRLPALLTQISSFVMTVVLMVIYYHFMHPTIGYIRRKSESREKPSNTEMTNFEANQKADEN